MKTAGHEHARSPLPKTNMGEFSIYWESGRDKSKNKGNLKAAINMIFFHVCTYVGYLLRGVSEMTDRL